MPSIRFLFEGPFTDVIDIIGQVKNFEPSTRASSVYREDTYLVLPELSKYCEDEALQITCMIYWKSNLPDEHISRISRLVASRIPLTVKYRTLHYT